VKLPLVNVFNSSYEAWTTRDPTLEEMQECMRENGYISPFINDTLIARVSNHFDAANYMASCGADNGLENHIDRHLDQDPNYKSFR